MCARGLPNRARRVGSAMMAAWAIPAAASSALQSHSRAAAHCALRTSDSAVFEYKEARRLNFDLLYDIQNELFLRLALCYTAADRCRT